MKLLLTVKLPNFITTLSSNTLVSAIIFVDPLLFSVLHEYDFILLI